jgi:hypothetical protein
MSKNIRLEVDLIMLKVNLIMTQTELIKLKANDHDWAVYVPDDVKKIVNDTLAEIKAELEGLS